MGWGAHEGMGWWMLFGGVAWILFIGVIVYFASTLARQSPGPAAGPPEPPLEIAKRRLASGEISEDEFQRIAARLREL